MSRGPDSVNRGHGPLWGQAGSRMPCQCLRAKLRPGTTAARAAGSVSHQSNKDRVGSGKHSYAALEAFSFKINSSSDSNTLKSTATNQLLTTTGTFIPCTSWLCNHKICISELWYFAILWEDSQGHGQFCRDVSVTDKNKPGSLKTCSWEFQSPMNSSLQLILICGSNEWHKLL